MAAGAGVQYGLAVAGERERENRWVGRHRACQQGPACGQRLHALPPSHQACQQGLACGQRPRLQAGPTRPPSLALHCPLPYRQAVPAVPLQHRRGRRPRLLLLGRLHRLSAGGARGGREGPWRAVTALRCWAAAAAHPALGIRTPGMPAPMHSLAHPAAGHPPQRHLHPVGPGGGGRQLRRHAGGAPGESGCTAPRLACWVRAWSPSTVQSCWRSGRW